MKLYRPLPRKIELLIFTVVTLVCTNSAYQLFLVTPRSTSELQAPGRGPAGVITRGESFQTLDLGCVSEAMTVDAASDRVRIKGSICAASTARSPASAPLHMLVENPASHHRAEVYFEKSWPQFTTDFIPLVTGTNTIELNYKAADKTDRKIRISIQKN